MQGFVGGRPEPVRVSGDELRAIAGRVESVVPPYVEAARAGADAAGAPAPADALDRCAAVWERALVALSEQLDALGVVAGDAAADLHAADGS